MPPLIVYAFSPIISFARWTPPGAAILRGGWRGGGCCKFGGEIGRIQIGALEAVGIETGAEAGREPVQVTFDPEAAGGAVGHDVDAR